MSVRAPECEIQTLGTQHIVVTVFQWQYAVVPQARGAAPDHDITMLQSYSASWFCSRVAAKQENRRQA